LGIFVTDTHPLVWYLEGGIGKLGRHARRVYEQAEAGRSVILIPTVVMIELLYLVEFKGMRLDYEWCITEIELSDNFDFVPLDIDAMRTVRRAPSHLEQLDRWIVAAALSRDAPLITKDSSIIDSGAVEVVW